MIRKTFVSTSALLAVLGTTAVQGAVVASDDFTYADGALNGSNGGTGWAGAWDNRTDLVTNNTTDATDAVVGGVATVSGDNSDVFDDQGASFRTMNSTLSTGDVWISVDMAFSAGASTSSFIGLQGITGAPPATGDPTVGASSSWRVGQEWTSSDWRIADNFGSTGTGTVSSTDAGNLDNLLVHIDYNAGSTSLWINAVDGVALGVADAVYAATPGSFDTLIVRTGGSGGTTRTAALDNLIVATLESDVRVVPEPSSLALLGLGGLLVARRRRG